MQNRRLRLDYKATESWLFSVTKLIWGIFRQKYREDKERKTADSRYNCHGMTFIGRLMLNSEKEIL